jgi:hypothetical protein
MKNDPPFADGGPGSLKQIENQQISLATDFPPPSTAKTNFPQLPGRKKRQVAKVDALSAFRLRCEVRALLVAEGELDFQTAVDELQTSAVKSSIIEVVGQDAVQAIMANAFAKVRP